MDLRIECARSLARVLGLSEENIESLLEIPPQAEMGDLAMPCFSLARSLKKAPQVIASELASQLQAKNPMIREIKAQGPYLNFFFDRAAYAEAFFREEQPGYFFTHQDEGQGKTIIVEYSSPNIAKPFHVGHAFSTCLGDAISRIYTYLGYNVVRLNHLGDYGTQFGKLIVAWKRWGQREALEEDAIKELTRVYVKFHQEVENEPELDDEARQAFKNLEEKKPEELKLWQDFRDLSLKKFSVIYDRMGISFDNYNGESFYSDKIPAVVEELKQKGLLEESQGAQVVRLDEFNLNPCLILKSDGTTIYASRDIAAIFYRDKTWNFTKNIYVVGAEQKNHFKQVFGVLERMGYKKARDCIHVAFGRLSIAGGEDFSTRKGKVILLEDLLDQSVAKVRSIMAQNNPEMSEQELDETAEIVGIAAVKHAYLRNGREKNIVFSWEEMLDFEGDTAPYMLYTYARSRSILRKAAVSADDLCHANSRLLITDDEFTLIKDMAAMEDAVLAAAKAYEPCILTRQINLACRDFNKFYHNISILKAENQEIREARLALCSRFSEVLSLALGLLGLKTVERM